jgi:hypothetical protein
MKKIIYKALISLTITLCMFGVSFAADSSSIAVSCSIPAVPDLNAPPFPDKNTQQAVSTATPQQKSDELKNAPQETPIAAIQQETKKEIVLASGETASVVTQTIYSR